MYYIWSSGTGVDCKGMPSICECAISGLVASRSLSVGTGVDCKGIPSICACAISGLVASRSLSGALGLITMACLLFFCWSMNYLWPSG